MTVKRFGIAVGLLVCGLCFSAPLAQASLLAHSEVHVSNFRTTGGLDWGPWLNIAAAGAFDDPSGWSQAYDDDPGATGQASADAATTYASAHSVASANLFTIDASGNLNNTTNNAFALNAYGYGELYSTFQIILPFEIESIFSLDWSASLSGESSSDQSFYADYAVQLLVSDGTSEWSQEAFYTLSGTGALQSISQSGTLVLPLSLQPFTLYSVDILAHPEDINRILSEPPTMVLFAGAGLLGLAFGFLRRKSV